MPSKKSKPSETVPYANVCFPSSYRGVEPTASRWDGTVPSPEPTGDVPPPKGRKKRGNTTALVALTAALASMVPIWKLMAKYGAELVEHRDTNHRSGSTPSGPLAAGADSNSMAGQHEVIGGGRAPEGFGGDAPVRDELGTGAASSYLSLSSGTVLLFGQHGHVCSRDKDGTLVMRISDRDGDWAMCCDDLPRSISVSQFDSASADVFVQHPEQQLEVKLEQEGKPQIFLVHGNVLHDTRQMEAHEFTDREKSMHPNRVCVAAVGKGPSLNEVRFKGIAFHRRGETLDRALSPATQKAQAGSPLAVQQ